MQKHSNHSNADRSADSLSVACGKQKLHSPWLRDRSEDRAFGRPTETVDSGSIYRSGQMKDNKNWYSQLFCLTYSIKRDSVKPPPCSRQVAASLEDRKTSLLSPGLSNLVNKDVNYNLRV